MFASRLTASKICISQFRTRKKIISFSRCLNLFTTHHSSNVKNRPSTTSRETIPENHPESKAPPFDAADPNLYVSGFSPVEGFQGEEVELTFGNAKDIFTKAAEYAHDPEPSIQGTQNTFTARLTDEMISDTTAESGYSQSWNANSPRIILPQNLPNLRKGKNYMCLSAQCSLKFYKLKYFEATISDSVRWPTSSKYNQKSCFQKHYSCAATVDQNKSNVGIQTDSNNYKKIKTNSCYTGSSIPNDLSTSVDVQDIRRHRVSLNVTREQTGIHLGKILYTPSMRRIVPSTALFNGTNQQYITYLQRSFSNGRKLDRNEQGEVDSAASENKLSQKARLKRAVKEYGTTVIVFHIGIALTSLGGFYAIVSSGLDVVGLLIKLGLPESVFESSAAAGASTFVVAYAVHKVFAPVRIAITLTAAPLIVRYLRRTGFLKPPKI